VADGRVSLASRTGVQHRLWQKFERIWPPLAAAVLLLGAWELAVWWFQLPNYVLPTPHEIVSLALSDPGHLLDDTLATVLEGMGGYLAGAALGLALALVFVSVPALEHSALPLYVTINSVPMVAYGPLAIIWFGNGPMSKVILIVVAVSYTVLINVNRRAILTP
jgi:NitT/TauT family transport system permease protein